MKKSFLLFLSVFMVITSAHAGQDHKKSSKGRRIIEAATLSTDCIAEKYGEILSIEGLTDTVKKNEAIERIVIRVIKDWKKSSWWGTITMIFSGRNIYDSQPFVEYRDALAQDIHELVRNRRKLKNIEKRKKCNESDIPHIESLLQRIDELLPLLEEVREAIENHPRYIQEMDKIELKLAIYNNPSIIVVAK